jgi:hypothetical protein
MADEISGMNAAMAADDLYREETFTDRRVGTIQRLLPIAADGNPDPDRPEIYVGQTQVMTPAGALPISFEIPADNLEQAVAGFAAGAREALEDTMQRLEEMRREAASSIIVPEGGSGGGVPGGGMPGGGKIRMP